MSSDTLTIWLAILTLYNSSSTSVPAPGEIAVKKMIGDWCAYCDGVLFGLICDNNFYIKVTEPGKALLKEVILRPPYDGAKDYFYISDVDDRDYLANLIKATLPALPKPKLKKNPMR